MVHICGGDEVGVGVGVGDTVGEDVGPTGELALAPAECAAADPVSPAEAVPLAAVPLAGEGPVVAVEDPVTAVEGTVIMGVIVGVGVTAGADADADDTGAVDGGAVDGGTGGATRWQAAMTTVLLARAALPPMPLMSAK